MSSDQYTKILNIAARLVTTSQITEDLHDWIVQGQITMRQRKNILKIASDHNSKLKSVAIELRDAIQSKK